MRLFEITFDDGDMLLLYDIQAILDSNQQAVMAENVAVGMKTIHGSEVVTIEEVPLLAYNRRAMQAKVGAHLPQKITTEYFQNQLSIMFGNGGIILCDVNTKFDVDGEEHPIAAKRLRQGDKLKTGLIITNIIWVQGDPVSWAGTNAIELIMRVADMADLMKAYSRRISMRTGIFGIGNDRTEEPLWCAMRIIQGHTVIVSRNRKLFEYIVCLPDQATLKGSYVKGQATSEEEFTNAIMAVINNQGD